MHSEKAQKIYKHLQDYIDARAWGVQEKTFILLAIMSAFAMAFGIIVEVIGREPISSLLFTGLGMLVFGIIIGVVLRTRKIRRGMFIVSLALVFVLLPAVFIYNGGIYGGAPLWFAFVALYILMILEKGRRIFFLASEAVVMAICWYIRNL